MRMVQKESELAFVSSTLRANKIDIDVSLEKFTLAHGYLFHQFLSPSE